LIDELPAVLGDLPVGEIAATSGAPASERVARLVHRRDDAGLAKTVRTGQPRQARADDDHAKSRIGLALRHARLDESRGTTGVAARGKSGRSEAETYELSSVETRGGVLVENTIDGNVAVCRLSGDTTGVE
jgi:hypothetical protein